MVGLTDAQGSHTCHQVVWRRRSPGGAQALETFQSTWRGQASFRAPDFLRVFTEHALVTLALRFWACGKDIVVATRQTWSRPQLPEIMNEAFCLPMETERQEHAGCSCSLRCHRQTVLQSPSLCVGLLSQAGFVLLLPLRLLPGYTRTRLGGSRDLGCSVRG